MRDDKIILKLQNQLLKDAMNRESSHKSFPWMYDVLTIDDLEYVLITEGHFVKVIPRCLFMLDLGRVFDKPKINMSNFLREDGFCHTIVTNEKRTIDKYTCTVFAIDGQEQHPWVDDKLLSWFDIDSETEFVGVNWKSPIHIYNKGRLEGIVLPVMHPAE